jgi:hypothetical protein
LSFSLSFRRGEKKIIRRGIEIPALILATTITTGLRHNAFHKMELFICCLNNILWNRCISAIE